MRNPIIPAVLGLCLFTGCAGSPLHHEEQTKRVWASPIPDNPHLEVVAAGFKFTEGPACAPDGSIYFTDIPNNRIHRFDPKTGETTVFREDSGGANGLAFLGDLLIACEGKRRRVAAYRLDHQEPVWILADWAIHPFNSPNDVAVYTSSDSEPHGVLTEGLVFTDPRYGNRDDMKLPYEGVYQYERHFYRGFDLDIEKGEDIRPTGPLLVSADFKRLARNAQRPNGVGICHAFGQLYINDQQSKQVLRGGGAYSYQAQVFHDLADLGSPDGMTVDHAGRLYIAIFEKGILILSPEGNRLGFIETGPRTTNCTFAADGRTLYITSDGKLKRIKLNTGFEAAD